jgi:hypothetical protein
MQLTKLSAAPLHESKCRLMPAPSHSCAGTASQLIAGVRRTGEAPRMRGLVLASGVVLVMSVMSLALGECEASERSYAGCYRLTFGSWSPPVTQEALRPYLPPADIELSRDAGKAGAAPSKVIPPYDPHALAPTPQWAYWKEGESGELVVVWSQRFGGVAILLKRQPGAAVLRGTAETRFDDGGSQRSDVTATPHACATVP